MGDHATSDVFFYNNNIMDLYMLSLGTLIQEGPGCVFYAIRCQGYWRLIHNEVWHHTDTQTKTHNTPPNTMTHPYKYILTPPVMC